MTSKAVEDSKKRINGQQRDRRLKQRKQLVRNGALVVLLTLYVGDVVPDRAGDVIERKLVSMLDEQSEAIGSRVKRERREKMPFFGSH